MRIRIEACFAALAISVAACVAVHAQAPSARDTFWSASDLISVTPNPAAHRSARRGGASQKQSIGTQISPAAGSVGQPKAAPPEAGIELASLNGYGGPVHLVRSAADRLGLRCSLLKRETNGEYTEVEPDSVFHSGDHIRLSLLSNQPGFLYVIQQGSSGTWSPIYPPPSSGSEGAKIVAGKLQVIPSGTRAFAFDQHAGDEKLYVILSRTPIDDIDRVIRNLRNPQPAAAPAGGEASPALEASNVIPDNFIQRLASRDLTLVDEEKVDQKSSAGNEGEKAVYVVSKQADPQSSDEVMLGLHLRHE